MPRTFDKLDSPTLAVFCVCLVTIMACKEPAPSSTRLDPADARGEQAARDTSDSSIPAPMIPFEGGEFKPSLARHVEGQPFDAKGFAQQAECGECHGEIQKEWSQSMHAFASLSNDVYLASFKRFLKDRGEVNTRFCAGCHDPALMFDTQVTLADDTTPAQAHQGISCQSCHGVQEATTQGNASYTLSTTIIPQPVDGDAQSLAVHRKAASPVALRSNELCASCHRGTLTPEMGHDIVLAGLDELGPWRRSAWNHNQTWRIDEELPEQNCVGCHMPRVDGHASHRFAGGHSTFAAMIDAPEQLDAVRAQLEGAASVDLFALDRVPVHVRREDAHTVGLDVVIFNERVGHAFPGGAKDLRDTWVELVVTDERGELIASSGLEHEKTAREDYTYVLHARLASDEGDTQTDHDVSHFRTPVYDHTIKPRDAAVARYVFDLPKVEKPRRLDVRARVRHRRLTPDILEEACAFSKTEQGRAYKADTLTHRGMTPDPCITQPIIDVTTSRMTILIDADGSLQIVEHSTKLPVWQRYYRYGLGLLHHVQENLEEARVAFQAAARHLGEDGGERSRAMITQGLGMVSARQGRTDEAIALFEEADALVPDHPSNAYNTGEAYMRVWKFEEAAEAFERAIESGEDARILRRWAIALGSKSRHAEALEVAQRGLKSEPRDPDLLRSQMLAMRGLDGASEQAKSRTAQAYDVYKRDTKAPHVRDQCSRTDPVCRAERTPIGVRHMRQKK